MTFRLAPTALFLFAALSLGGAASAHLLGDPNSSSQLRVDAGIGLHAEIDVTLDLAGEPDPPGRITIYVPRGFQIYPSRPAGSTVGTAFLVAEDTSYGTPSQSTLPGDIVAAAPTADAACVTGRVTGKWILQLSLLGQPLDVPIYLVPARAGDPSGTATKLVLCAPLLPRAGSPSARALPIGVLELALQQLERPHNRGSYLWRASVTPLAPDRRTLEPARTYEVQALVGAQKLTLGGRYDARSRQVVLAGRLTAAGHALAGIRVEIVNLVRKVTADGVVNLDRTVGWASTSRTGTYSFKVQAKKTSGFVAISEPSSTTCHTRAVAPAGCRSATLSRAESDPVTVSIPERLYLK